MPAKTKALENIRKNLTIAEREAREQAEADTVPNRDRVKLKAPDYVDKDNGAKRYWQETVSRMEGITLLDDLDTEMLAVYCTMLSRRDNLNALCRQILDESTATTSLSETVLESVSKLDTLMGKLQRQEMAILQYAERLGLTPSGRVRLARKRAEARLVEEGDDLFGD